MIAFVPPNGPCWRPIFRRRLGRRAALPRRWSPPGPGPNRYSFAIMSLSSWRRTWQAARVGAASVRGLIRRQFITRNRRLAFVLAVLVIGIGIAAVHVSAAWISPDLMILPILAGGLLLWPRALRILFVIVAVMLAYDVAQADERTGFGVVATIVIIAAFADVLARTRARLGLQGLRGDQMLIELRDRIKVASAMPGLPKGWECESVLSPAGGVLFGGDFIVSACDGKMLEVAVVDVSGKGIDAGTRALLLSGAFGGLLGSVPASEFLSSCNAYLRRAERAEGFVTAVHLALDLTTGSYVISSAGHPPAAHFESGSGRWRLTQARGIVLGVVPDLRPGAEHDLLAAAQPGDCVLDQGHEHVAARCALPGIAEQQRHIVGQVQGRAHRL